MRSYYFSNICLPAPCLVPAVLRHHTTFFMCGGRAPRLPVIRATSKPSGETEDPRIVVGGRQKRPEDAEIAQTAQAVPLLVALLRDGTHGAQEEVG